MSIHIIKSEDKYLINLDIWVFGADGKQYKAIYGVINSVDDGNYITIGDNECITISNNNVMSKQLVVIDKKNMVKCNWLEDNVDKYSPILFVK